MQDAKRSIELKVPELVEISRFAEIRQRLTTVLHDEALYVHVTYHAANRNDLSHHVRGLTTGTFTADELDAAASSLFIYLSQRCDVLLEEVGGLLRGEKSLSSVA